MKKKILTISLMILASYSFSQDGNGSGYECNMGNPPAENTDKSGSCAINSSLYNDFTFWEPDLNEPIKYVNINMIFLQKDDGTGNFQQGNTDEDQFWTDIENNVNQRLANLSTSPDQNCATNYPTNSNCYSGSNNISDTRIRFKFNRIYIQDTYGWNNDNDNGSYKCPSNSWYLNTIDGQVVNNPNIPRGVNIYYSQGATNYNKNFHLNNCNFTGSAAYSVACSEFPSYSGYDRSSRIHYPDAFSKYYWAKNCYAPNNGVPWSTVRGWQVNNSAGSILHEVGHSFALGHCNGCENQVMNQCGICARNYLTPKNISQMHRALALTNMRTFVEDDPSPNNGLDGPTANYNFISITQNEVIDFNTKFYRDIVIQSGNSLTIKCKVIMPKNGKIIVKPGAKLIVDGGTITTESSEFWGGIKVWGNSSLNQQPLANPIYQGKVELKNGALIEYARNGITIWKSGDWNSMGGLIEASDATFLNCRRSVEFMAYPNFYNYSRFTKCNFIVDNNNKITTPNDFTAFVTLWNVKGVSFSGCDFEDNSGFNQFDVNNGNGIFSIDAGYNVSSNCSYPQPLLQGQPCPSSYYTASHFKNFNQGIYAMGSGTQNTVRVYDVNFIDNTLAASFNNLNNFKFTKNTVLTGGLLKQGYNGIYGNEQFGLKSFESSGYSIEENIFEGKNNPVLPVIGINIEESGSTANQTYRNTIKNTEIGQQFVGLNANFANSYEGLQFLCNFNSVPNQNDVVVKNQGIRVFQGSANPPLAAGNTFSTSPSSNHIVTYSQNAMIYNYNLAANKPINNTTGLIITNQVSQSNSCPSDYWPFSPLLMTLNSATSDFYTDRTTYDAALYNYYQVIDNGNTDSLVQAINMTWSSEAETMRNDLMNQAPYLSEQALWEAAGTGILTDAFLLEVSLANVDATRNEAYLDYVEYEIPNPLPASFVQLIYQNWDAETPRTLLENELGALNGNMGKLSNKLITYYMTDSINQIDSVKSILSTRKSLSSDYQLVELALAENNFIEANSMLITIQSKYELSSDLQAEHNNLDQYIQLRKNLNQNGKEILNLDSSDLSLLRVLAQNQTGKSSTMAQNILCFGYGECPTNEQPLLRKGHRRVYVAKSNADVAINNDIKVVLAPNPVKDLLNLSINGKFKSDDQKFQLELFNIQGKSVLNHSFNRKNIQINLSNLENGSYIYKIYLDNKILQTGKIIMQN